MNVRGFILSWFKNKNTDFSYNDNVNINYYIEVWEKDVPNNLVKYNLKVAKPKFY